jgi:predicted MPP superfamily phosphohydrolase
MRLSVKIMLLLGTVICGELVYFLYDQTTGIGIETPVIRNDRLAAAFAGARVMQLSDLHVGHLGVRERRLAETVQRANPDIVLITGDLIAGNRGIEPCCDLVRRFAHGRTVIAVLGNNDHSYRASFTDTRTLVAALRQAGAIVLINAATRLTMSPVQGGRPTRAYIIGLDDNFTGRDDIFAAMTGVPAGVPVILLAHAPAIIEKIRADNIDLVLSGHTHGGQIAVPFVGALYTNSAATSRERFESGLYHRGGRLRLYVNRGIGTVALPLRLFARPEVTIFRFVPENQRGGGRDGGVRNRLPRLH